MYADTISRRPQLNTRRRSTHVERLNPRDGATCGTYTPIRFPGLSGGASYVHGVSRWCKLCKNRASSDTRLCRCSLSCLVSAQSKIRRLCHAHGYAVRPTHVCRCIWRLILSTGLSIFARCREQDSDSQFRLMRKVGNVQNSIT